MKPKVESFGSIANETSMNKTLYKKIDHIIQNTAEIQDMVFNQCAQKIGNCISNFAREILDFGVKTISDEVVDAKMNNLINDFETYCESLIDVEFSTMFIEACEDYLKDFSRQIKEISNQVANDKQQGFRDLTSYFTRKIIVECAKTYRKWEIENA